MSDSQKYPLSGNLNRNRVNKISGSYLNLTREETLPTKEVRVSQYSTRESQLRKNYIEIERFHHDLVLSGLSCAFYWNETFRFEWVTVRALHPFLF